MAEDSRINASVKVASILVLLMNYAMTVNAAPLGTAEMAVSRFYWVLLLALLAILMLIYRFTKVKSPVEVVGLAYDKSSNKLELTVKNTGDESYSIKSALRLLQPTEEVVKDASADGRIPMASAKASAGSRQLFQLLAEDDSPITLAPNETRTIAYDLLLPQEHVKLDASKNVEVHISYSEEGEGSVVGTVSDDAAADGFCMKLESGEVVAEVFLLEDLLAALKNSPDETIGFHMRQGNDLALWVRNVVGDGVLADNLTKIQYANAGEARQKLIRLVDEKVESLKHPFLRKVSQECRFILKSDHDKVLSEIALLEDLAEALAKSPTEVVAFHTRQGNDFAAWIGTVVGDTELAARLSTIESATLEETKSKTVSAIRERVDSIKCSQDHI